MYKTIYYNINFPNLPPSFHDFRMVHLSDLHGAEFGAEQQDLLSGISGTHPDLIVMTGDMADSRAGAIDKGIELCRRLAAQWPVYYVLGNHEQVLSEEEKGVLQHHLQAAGVQILDNAWASVRRLKERLWFYGLTMPLVYYKDPLGEYERGIQFTLKEMEALCGEKDQAPGNYKILLAHNPLYFPAYRDWGADLTLSGHVHGGIIRLPYIGGVLSPDLSLFPRYDGGHFEEKGRHLIVSRGLGNRFLRRIWNPPELVVITLKRYKQN